VVSNHTTPHTKVQPVAVWFRLRADEQNTPLTVASLL
jgi:hypothetical protein